MDLDHFPPRGGRINCHPEPPAWTGQTFSETPPSANPSRQAPGPWLSTLRSGCRSQLPATRLHWPIVDFSTHLRHCNGFPLSLDTLIISPCVWFHVSRKSVCTVDVVLRGKPLESFYSILDDVTLWYAFASSHLVVMYIPCSVSLCAHMNGACK